MSTKETGGPAFPVPNDANVNDQEGMTLRDYFAAKAMQGFASSDEAAWIDGAIGMAKESYAWADAMLKARTS